MVNVKLCLSYDGTDFVGFQSQKDQSTIEDELKKALYKITGKIKIYYAGRTDAGVHAQMQVINFFTDRVNMNEFNWIMAFNSILPKTIRIQVCEFVDENFHARKSVKKREYWYYVINSPFISALQIRYASHFPREMDVKLLQDYTNVFIGEHDFTSFCSTKDINHSKIRRIESFVIDKKNDMVIFKIIGNAFLQHMVRTMIGTILELHKKKISPKELVKILEGKNRKLAGQTYCARGLVLKKIYY